MTRHRLVIVYDKRIARKNEVRDEVLNRALRLPGWTIAKYEVWSADVNTNIMQLAQILLAGDLVIAAGNESTAHIALNGCILAQKNVTLGVLGYGTYNDMAKSLGAENLKQIIEAYSGYLGGFKGLTESAPRVREFWPLQVLVNGQHLRFCGSYFSTGMSACIIPGKTSKMFKWWRKNKNAEYLPEFTLNNVSVDPGATDYMAVNSKMVLGKFKNDRYFARQERFLSYARNFRSFNNALDFYVKGKMTQIPGDESADDVVRFTAPATITLQTDGVRQKLAGVQQIEVRKARSPMRVVVI